MTVNFAKLPELLGKPPPSPELPQFAASSMDGCVDDQDYNDGAQNDNPIGKLNARYRCLFAKPFHDHPPIVKQRLTKGEAPTQGSGRVL